MINFKKFLESIKAALRGIKSASSERTFRLFLIVAFLIILSMFLLEISLEQKLILILTITIVMSLELINSQVERVLNLFHPTEHPEIKLIKDISAGAVFLACLGALVIGIWIFLPQLLKIIW